MAPDAEFEGAADLSLGRGQFLASGFPVTVVAAGVRSMVIQLVVGQQAPAGTLGKLGRGGRLPLPHQGRQAAFRHLVLDGCQPLPQLQQTARLLGIGHFHDRRRVALSFRPGPFREWC